MIEDFYPQKPELVDKKRQNNLLMTIGSIVLFVLLFMVFFTEELNFILSLVVVLLVHELGHFLLMKNYNYKHVRMLFVPFMGAFVQGEKEEYSQKESLLVSVAGPFPGIVIGIILVLFSASYESNYVLEFGLLFFILNFINLLPLDPLDGASILKLLFKINQEMFSLVFTFASSLAMILVGWFISSWLMIGFGFLMGFRVKSIQSNMQLRKLLREENVEYQTSYRKLSNRDYSIIKNILLDKIPNLRTVIDSIDESEGEQLMASQVNNTLESPLKYDASLALKVAILLYWVAVLALPIAAYIYFDLLIVYYDWFKI
ncbi:MAG: site-2 protease family protein [Bacteroidota bacterium]